MIDGNSSMAIWHDEIDAFIAVVRRLQIFRRIRVGRAWPPEVTSRHCLVVVVTDGVDDGWRSRSHQRRLAEWAIRAPVALIHVLPQGLWHRTGVEPERAKLLAPAVGAANATLRCMVDSAASAPDGQDGFPVPVLQLSADWLATWAAFVGRPSRRWTSFPVLMTSSSSRTGRQKPSADPRRLVREFASYATSTAFDLARLLAAAPLYPGAVRTIQRELQPTSGTSHLAEIFMSDLMAPPEAGRSTRDFRLGVRTELLAAGRRNETIRVWRLLSSELPELSVLSRILDSPDDVPLPSITPASRALVVIEHSVLRALSGRYIGRARRLGEAIDTSALGLGTTAIEQQSVTIETPSDIHTRRHDRPEGVGVGPDRPSQTAVAQPTLPKTPAIWGNLPPRNPNFTGRKKMLTYLHEQVQGGTTAVLPHALHGMGGVGKSHLAIEYVYQHQSEYDLIWWIPSERPTQIVQALVELAQRMGLQTGPDVGSARSDVQEALRLGITYPRWLLVFDNAESPEILHPFLPPTGSSGRIIITSRNPQWSNLANTLEVDVFTREESVQLLRRRNPDLNDHDADRLAEALGDLPLALEQAAAWQAETGMPADEYLRLFAERLELLEQAPPLGYQLPVAAAWNVSLDRLVVSNPAAFRLLQLCSFLAPEPIPRSLFTGAQNQDIHPELNEALFDPMKLNRAIRDINRYALARVLHRTNSIQMHRLIQAVLKDRMSEPERESMRSSAHLLLATGDRNDPDSPGNWRSYADLYPHLMASDAVHSTNPRVQQLVSNEVRYLYWWGDFAAALELSQSAYDTWRQQVGEDAGPTLNIGHWLGFMLYVLGRHREAATQNTRILEAYERTNSEDSEELLRAVGAVAADKRAAGDFAGALEIDENLYQRHVRVLGPDDPATLNSAHNLAVSLRLAGRLRRAYEVDKETYDHRVLLFGEDHAHTLESHLNLIIDRRELGEYRTARIQMQEIVDRLQQEWGSEQTQTLRAKRRLAAALRKAGDHTAALNVSTEIYEQSVDRYGPNHPDTLLAGLGLAVDQRATGQLAAAAQLGEQVRISYRDLFDEEHPYTVAAALNAAIVYRLQGDLDHALRTNQEGLAILTRRLGPDHPLTLAGALNLANDLYVRGDYEGSHSQDVDCVERMSRVLGDEHPTTLICQGNLAMDLVALGRRTEAYALHGEVVPVLQRTLGDDHPATRAGFDLNTRGDCDLDPMPL